MGRFLALASRIGADPLHVGEAAYKLLKDNFELEPRGVIEIKGKGAMSTWFLTGEQATA